MKHHYSSILVLAASFAAFSQLSAQLASESRWSKNAASSDWSDPDNWQNFNVPDSNTEKATIHQFDTSSHTFNVDNNFTINAFEDLFPEAGKTTTLSGTGILTIDRDHSSNVQQGIQNLTGGTGGTLSFAGNVTIDNSQGGVTGIINANGINNIIFFEPLSVLTLNTSLEAATNQDPINTSNAVQFNGTIKGSGNLRINSNEVSFNSGHNSSGSGADAFTGSIDLYSNSKLTVDGGTVLNSGSKFQINGDSAELELNAANVINEAGLSIGGDNSFTFDVNANQEHMGFLRPAGNNSLNIELDSNVTSLHFLDSSTFAWGSGASITISGFEEGVIRFGTDGNGLTGDQLDKFNGIFTLDPQGYLIPEPANAALLLGLIVAGLASRRRR